MSKRIEIDRKANFHCPACGNRNAVMLAVNADDEAITCARCGHQVATMGALLDRAMQSLAERLADGLARRRDRIPGRH